MPADGVFALDGPMRGSIANFEAVACGVGNTRFMRIPSPQNTPARLLVKLEGCNPTGSVKDRARVAMLRVMIQDPDWNQSLQETTIKVPPGIAHSLAAPQLTTKTLAYSVSQIPHARCPRRDTGIDFAGTSIRQSRAQAEDT